MTEEQQQEESRIQVVGCAFILFAFCPVIITNMQVQNFELPGTLKFDLGVRCWDTLQIQIQIQIQMHIIMLSNQSMLKVLVRCTNLGRGDGLVGPNFTLHQSFS